MRNYSLYAIILIFITLSIPGYSTGDSLHILTFRDSVMIQKDSVIGTYFLHQVTPKQTLYSLCKFYGIKPDDLKEINPELKVRTLHIGEEIRVPISEKLIRSSGLPTNRESYAPVYYEVRKGEGLYRIAKNYFSLKPEQIQKLNSLSDNNIHLGQKLLLGWIPLAIFDTKAKAVPVKKSDVKTDKKDTKPEVVTSAEVKSDKALNEEAVKKSVEKAKKEEASNTTSSLKDKYDDHVAKKSAHSDQGAAFWHKELAGSKGLYILHRTAAPNTVIKITNPMFQTTVYAKVLGNIPKDTYPDDVMVIVSPEVAKKLGAKDSRFFCKIGYFTK